MARLKERPPLRPAAVGGPERTLVTTSTVKFLRGVANPLTCMNICNNTSYVGLLPKPSSFPLTGQIDCEKATLSLSFFLSLSFSLSLSLSFSLSLRRSVARSETHSPFLLVCDRQGLFRPDYATATLCQKCMRTSRS